jgi:sugar phosphate isomerase/epimerase
MKATLAFADFGMDTASLAGSLEAKLATVRAAGFSQVMISAADVVGHPGGTERGVRAIRESGLRVTGYEALRDFEGLTGPLHAYKVDVAKAMLEVCASIGGRLLLVEATTLPHADRDHDVLLRDLRKLAMLAIPLGIRIAYKSMPAYRSADAFTAAADVVLEANCPNLGLALDSFDALAAHVTPDDLDAIDPEQVFLVQLSDFMWKDLASDEEQAATATHFRVFPGEGVHSDALAAFVTRLDRLGYVGDYSLDVYNDDYRQLPPEVVAERARRSAVWLGETVLRRTLPVPNLERRSAHC